MLKLKVGKIYRNRKGEEMKIVVKYGEGKYPYKDDNDKSYTESGRWYDFDEEDPGGLLEEAKEIRHTFTIADNVKTMTIEQVGNCIVIEMVPEERKEPKPGDVMINKFGSVYIFKKVYDDGWHSNFVWVDSNGRAFYSNTATCSPGRPATPEEAQLLWDALKKAGKRWNSKTMQVEDVRPKPGDVMINEKGSVYIFKKVDGNIHNFYAWLGDDGRVFYSGVADPGCPATSKEAKLLFDALKKEGKQWNPETMEVEDVPEIDHIRKWVEKHLNCRYYSHEGLTKVIYNYLKYKEGEK